MTIFLVAVLVLLGVIIVGSIQRTFPAIKFINRTTFKWILAVYTVMLVLSVVVLYALPRTDFAANSSDQGDFKNIFNTAKTGNLDQFKGKAAKSTWSLAYSGSQLDIEGETDPVVFAERKSSDDGIIDVSYYVATANIDGIDFTNRLKPPVVELIGNKLRVGNPPPYQVNLAKFTKDFTINQFSDKGSDLRGPSGREMLLLIRIPKDLQIYDPTKRIRYMSE